MDLISGLQQMGLTEYEAKIYAALVKQPSITGYEASKLSGGVPRAKVYETLESLVRKKSRIFTISRREAILHSNLSPQPYSPISG